MQFYKISRHQHQLLALNLEYDFYHVSEHLQRFADATFNDEKKRKSWFQKARKTLKKGNVLNLIKQIDEFIISATGERCKTTVSQRDYILGAYGEGRLNYARILAKKLPIGSGAIKSLIRQVVNLIMKCLLDLRKIIDGGWAR